jgi:hypothetical protein
VNSCYARSYSLHNNRLAGCPTDDPRGTLTALRSLRGSLGVDAAACRSLAVGGSLTPPVAFELEDDTRGLDEVLRDPTTLTCAYAVETILKTERESGDDACGLSRLFGIRWAPVPRSTHTWSKSR